MEKNFGSKKRNLSGDGQNCRVRSFIISALYSVLMEWTN
jgi:hypothetical protein